METATYGSEFVAAKTATEQIMDLRYTLRYLGVPIKSKSYMFGDNRSVVTSASLPHSTLSKRHNIQAFHRVREAIAAKIIDFHWIQSEYNLSDMLSKHWEHIKILFPMIQKLLITCGPITLIPRSATERYLSLPNDPSILHIRFKPPRIFYPNYIQDSSHLHIHTQNYIYILLLHVKYNNMPHPPQEGSNRSLAYCTLLDVLWQMCHSWIMYGMLRRTILLINKSYEANDGQQETPHSACL